MTSEDMLIRLRGTAHALMVTPLAEYVLTFPCFTTWSGSINNRHHYGDGGLLRHTYEVVELCFANKREIEKMTTRKLNGRVLFLAALFHDLGKIMDYELHDPYIPGTGNGDEPCEWVSTDHHSQIHHISRSAIIWSKLVEKTGLCKDIEDQVTHCILSHHGSPKFHSPVYPQTREAWVLHLCDSMSAWMDMCGKVEVRG